MPPPNDLSQAAERCSMVFRDARQRLFGSPRIFNEIGLC